MKTTHKSIIWLLAAFTLMAAGMAFTVWSYRQIEQAAAQRTQTRTLTNEAEEFLSALKDAETGQRGFILTGTEAYLQPYLAVRDSIGDNLKALRQHTGSPQSQQHLDAIKPLLETKLAELSKSIALRRNHDMPGVLAQLNNGDGKRVMDAIRLETARFIALQETLQRGHEIQFDASMRRMLGVIAALGLLTLMLALYFAYSSYQAAQQRLRNLVHLETQHLLEAQQHTNQELQRLNITLQTNEDQLSVTLSSIGDGVIATDARACITLLNPVAQELTGWTLEQALGRPVDEIFHIINKDTRAMAHIPVADALEKGTVQGLANHTVLIARDGREFDIADSCAPIRNPSGAVVGAVLVFRNVTDEYAVQQTLRDSAAQVQTILNTVVDGIATVHAHGGIIESVNPAIEHMFGYTSAELCGKAFGQLVPELDQEQHNVSLDYYRASDEAQAVGAGREVMGQRKDGSMFPLEIAVSEMTLRGQRYFTGILRDISTRKQAEEALRKAGALQKAIFDSANFSSIATDAKGVIQIFNVGAERMLGYSAGEVMNIRTPADISDPQEVIERAKALSVELATEIAPGFEALVFKAARGIEDIYELTYIRKDGTRFPAVVSVTALRDDDNAIIGYLLIGTDNTARKRIEAERSQLDSALQVKNVELENARQTADKANLAKSEFLSSMSHELRSPLNAILGFAQLMDSGVPSPTTSQKASIDQILRAGWYLLELINEILDLALIESGKLSMSMEPTSLPEVLFDCKTMIEPLANKRGIRMQFPSFSGPCFVDADCTRLKQVVVNLLTNAIKYNRMDGSLEVVCSQGAADHLRISVRDTGEGLTAYKLTQLFQPFNRLGQEDHVEEGTGIGLVVSKRLVELMGGCIGAQSTVGVGSEFWIELKQAQPPEVTHDVDVTALAYDSTILEGDQVRTLLYVEDNLANMELVAQLVSRRPDLRLLRASDGVRGIALARTQLPDVILMDINLPGISGIRALELLREDPLTRHIPVLALSANAMPRDIEKGLDAGFFRYLTKPIKIGEFMEALDKGISLAKESAAKRNEKSYEIGLKAPC